MKQQKTSTGKHLYCYHCGDICSEEHVVFDGKDFCCHGCKTVYEILNENNLCNYYDLNQSPGLSLKNREYIEKYAFLDNKEIQNQLMDFNDGQTAKISFYIPSIHCSSCIWLLENLYKIKKGIRYSRVNFTRKELNLDFNPEIISLKELVIMLASIGYEPHISLEEKTKNKFKSVNKELLIRIGIAGFAFGNIMLLSFPEYFGFEGIEDLLIRRFISWLNIVLALPVVFYCSSLYFKSAWKGIKQRFINIDVPVSLGILTLFTISVVHVTFNTGPGYLDSLSGLVFFLLVGRWIQNKTYEGLSFERDYRSYFPLAVIRLMNNKEESIPVKNIRKHDIIMIRNGEIIPADSILTSDMAFIDYSFVTGESEPVLRGKNERIFAGGRQVGSAICLRVEKEISQSYLTQLWNHKAFQKDGASHLQSMVNVISKYFTVVVLVIALSGFFIWTQIDISKAWFVFTAVLIVACPCALSLSSPFTLGNTMNIFGRNHFYLKNSHVIEKLAGITHIVFDKTGTLTENYQGDVSWQGDRLDPDEKTWIRDLVSNSTHPLSRKIRSVISTVQKSAALQIEDFREIGGLGIAGNVSGHRIQIGSGQLLNGDFESRSEKNDSIMSRVYVSIDGKTRGAYFIKDKYRSGIEDLIDNLGRRYRLSVLSGDNESEKDNLKKIFPESTSMNFRQKPVDKLKYIQHLQEQGENVLMLGDGLNDAGALVQSDTGIAITEDITSFTPASDAILGAGNINLLDEFIQFSRRAKYIIIISFIISFLYNVIGMGFALGGKLIPVIAAILMPASSITVVFFTTFAVNILAKIRNLI